jgi:CheY-like chemotaxis protein
MIKPNILVVEDDKDTQKFLKLFLGRKYEVEVCNSDITFYELINIKKFNLIIMDISIKGSKNGLQLTKEIKSSEKFKDIPIICLSAHIFDRDRKNAYLAGADMFLAKPVSNDLLCQTINSYIKSDQK